MSSIYSDDYIRKIRWYHYLVLVFKRKKIATDSVNDIIGWITEYKTIGDTIYVLDSYMKEKSR